MPVKIFFCYAHEDEALLNKLKTHLKPLQRKGLIDVWYDRDISAGTKWEKEIDKHLNNADIILLLVSSDFMNSDYCYGKEMQRALTRDKRGEARVIPIILRPVSWQDVLGDLQALPTDGRPVVSSSWQYQDEAFLNVTEGIRKVVMQLTVPPTFASSAIPVEMLHENPFLSPPVLKPASKQRLNVSPFLLPLAVDKLAFLYILKGHTNSVYSVALSADGQTLVSGSADKTIKVWNLSIGQELRTLIGHTATVWSVALSADGQTLVSGSPDKTIKVWNLSTGQQPRTLIGHTQWVNSVALSADGQTLVSGSADKTIKVWNLSTGQQPRTLKGRIGRVIKVALSADGQTLVNDSLDEPIKVWNLSTGQELRTLTGDLVGGLSADGQTLVSRSDDNTIRMWNLSTGQELRTLTGHTKDVISVALSADGQTLVSGSADNTIRVWRA